MLGGSDVSGDTSVNDLTAQTIKIHKALTEKGATCVMCTIEPRVTPQNHPLYIDPERYKEITNAVNKKQQKVWKDNLIFLGGLTFPVDLRVMDVIHPTPEGRRHVWNKVSWAIEHFYEIWKQNKDQIHMMKH